MRKGFYPQMAWTGISRNKKLYLPYILTCIGMVMMFYIISFLSVSSVLQEMKGGASMQAMLGLGRWIMAAFSLIFLFYTSSFLNRRRNKEFGLYNILGMGKRNLAHILLWEGLMITAISLAGGLIGGIALSKFAELGMVNMLKGEIDFALRIEIGALIQTVVLFAVIFGLIFLNTLRQLKITNPIELLHSEHSGEKPPKANWIFAALGVVLLAIAYYLAVTIKDPIEAMTWFFVAVIMVIVATYLLFVAGSVTLCRILQKNKNYYYKKNHFVSVSSMVYRMKRNGAGLASICVLCTMVLVMVSTTVCLYAGAEDSLRTMYPRNIVVTVAMTEAADFETIDFEKMESNSNQAAAECNLVPENIMSYRMAQTSLYLKDGRFQTRELVGEENTTTSNLWQIFVVPLEDYNRTMQQNETLADGEAIVAVSKGDYTEPEVTVNNDFQLKVKKTTDAYKGISLSGVDAVPSIYLFVPDFQNCVENLDSEIKSETSSGLWFNWIYGYDLDAEDEAQIPVIDKTYNSLCPILEGNEHIEYMNCQSVADSRSDFYGLYGSLFFLGILLGAVFIFAAVLIMYYKQVTEGYEDQSRFEIMQKVGMTKKDIRQSINSQVLTVFFAPLLMAGLHLLFAFPMVSKLLMMFGLSNIHLLTIVTLGCFLIFAIFYILVYRITSGAYYNIVSGVKEA